MCCLPFSLYWCAIDKIIIILFTIVHLIECQFGTHTHKQTHERQQQKSEFSLIVNEFSLHFRLTDTDDSIFYCDTNATGRISKRNTVCGDLLSEITSSLHKDSFIVTSVPNNLNIISVECLSDDNDVTNERWSSSNQRNNANNYWQDVIHTPSADSSVASKNFDLAQTFGVTDYNSGPQQTPHQQKIINSSYSNLTLLDYSGSSYGARNSFGNQLRIMAEKKRQSPSASNRNSRADGELDKCSSLVDEISAHFDRSLSILNDKKMMDVDDDEVDMACNTLLETKKIVLSSASPSPPQELHIPQPPPRKHQTKPNITNSISDRKSMPPMERYTFDRDPTNLKTCYAESLEKCNFNGSSNSINLLEALPTIATANGTVVASMAGGKFSPTKHSTPIKHELIASTPNLYQHRSDRIDSEEYLQSSSAYNSLNPLPQTETVVPTKSILSAGSRSSLGKGVSFYPYVSEISWHEQSSVDATPDLSDDESR